MALTFNCPTCGAPLHASGSEANINCEYCGASVIVPAELRTSPAAQPAQASPSVSVPTFQPDDPAARRAQLRQVMQMIREGRADEAASLLSGITNTPVETTRPMVERIASALGGSGRINPLELMAILSQISPGEEFWGPSQPARPAYQPPARSVPRRRGSGAGCLIFVLVAAALYVSSSTPAHIMSQAATLFNQVLRLLH